MRLQSAFDGSFYPDEPKVLQTWVDDFLAGAPPAPDGEVMGMIVPHAGYVYSGATAGKAIGVLRGRQVDRVVLMGPSHRYAVDGVRVFELDGFETPLGPVASDAELADELIEALGPASQGPPFPEHSVEVQLPLLKRACPSASVVELVFGPPEAVVHRRVGAVLAELWRRHRVVVVASSDLSHYYPREQAKILDGHFRDLLVRGDPEEMAVALGSGVAQACGAGPVLSLMEMTRELQGSFHVVAQTDSSEASGDESQVVGYLSALSVKAPG